MSTVLFLLLFAWNVLPAQNTIYVSNTATGNADGSSWEDAYTSLQDALTAANFGDQLWLKEGTYTPADAPDYTWELPSGVKLYGGFSGTENSLDARDWEMYETILSGSIDGINFSSLLLLAENPDSSTTVDGLVVKGVYSNNPIPCDSNFPCLDGGITVEFWGDNSNVGFQLYNCSVRNNYSSQGAGMSIISDEVPYRLIIENVIFENNNSNNSSGGLFIGGIGASIVIQGSQFINNSSMNFGGGAHIYEGEFKSFEQKVTVQKTVFYSNEIEFGFGGGLDILTYGPTEIEINIDSCTFFENSAGFPAGDLNPGLGGGLSIRSDGDFNSNNIAWINNCFFENNYAEYQGGGMFASSLNFSINNSQFFNNKSQLWGGAVSLLLGPQMVVYFNSSSFVKNQCDGEGEHFDSFFSDGGIANIENCLFYKEALLSGEYYFRTYGKIDLNIDHSYFNVTDCDSINIAEGLNTGSITCGPNNLFNIDPQFANPGAGDYSLDYCSPLIDAGSSEPVYQFDIETDLIGSPRIINCQPDIGAYENNEVLIQLETQNESCSGMDGFASVNPSGGLPPWQINWSNGNMGNNISNLEAGEFTVQLTDAVGCSRSCTFEILPWQAIQAYYAPEDASSASTADGSITQDSIFGGNPPLTYAWSNGEDTPNIDNLLPGTYELTITDATNCDTSLVFEVGFPIGIKALNKKSISVFPNPASEVLYVSGHLQAATFLLYDILGREVKSGLLDPEEASISLNGLSEGMYYLRLLDDRQEQIVSVVISRDY
ncbi:MAG: T9SS type A sorting domain-containing protein [Bacteroidetes bacterium]|nr:T9SS type A sorting domain-containing protein [Bacteroidota bacterium]